MPDPGRPQPVAVAELEPGSRFDRSLFHRDGTPLLLAGAAVDEALATALGEVGIGEVYVCETPEALRVLRESGELVEVDFTSLPDGAPVPRNLYDEAGELVCARGHPLTNAMLGDLVRRGAARLFERHGSEEEAYEVLRERFEEALAAAVVETLEKRIEHSPSLLRVEPGGEPYSAACRRPRPGERPRETIEEQRREHALALAAVHGVLERVRRENMLDLPAAKEIVGELIERVARDLPLALALVQNPRHSDYLVDHSYAVATHALATGLALRYSREQCGELALGALLHDVGMARVREEVLKKEGPLSPEELAEIREHPRAGLELLKSAPGVSMPLPFAVFQDHERTDGRGYPLGRSDGWIHDHAKIIAVADVYQAMTAPRPYKPRRAPHRAVQQLLRMVQENMLDPVVVRAFLSAHGAFPLASWVRLSDGSVARVVDAWGEPFDRPVVTVLADSEWNELPVPQVVDLKQPAGEGAREGGAEELRVAAAIDPATLRSGARGSQAGLLSASARFAELVAADFAAGFFIETRADAGTAAPPSSVAHPAPRETAAQGATARETADVAARSSAAAGHEPVQGAHATDDGGAAVRARKVPTKYLDWSASFSGYLSDFALVDLVQILDVSQKSGVLVLRLPEALGEIRMSEGEILSAEFTSASGEELRDEEAIFRMVEFAEGTFRFEQGAIERRRSVRSNNTMILMEACRLQDEKGRDEAGGEAGAAGRSASPAATP